MPKKETQPKAENWKTMDLDTYVVQDLKAAITLLDLILNHPHILQAVVVEVKALRDRMIEAELKQQAQVQTNIAD